MGLNLQATLGLDQSGFDAGIRRAESLVRGLKNIIAGAFSVGAITALTHKTLEYASHLNDLSSRLGVSTDFLQEFQYVAKQTGTDLEGLVRIMERVNTWRNKALGGDQKAIAAGAAFGLTQDNLKTKRIDDVIVNSIATAFERGDAQGKLGAAWREMGGRGAGELIPAFTDGLKKGMKAAKDAGAVMSEDVIQQLDDVGDQFAILADVLTAKMGPAIIGVVNVIRRLIEALDEATNFIIGKANDLLKSASGRDKEDQQRRQLNEEAIQRREKAGTITPERAAEERRINSGSVSGSTGVAMAGEARDEYYDQHQAEAAERQRRRDARRKQRNNFIAEPTQLDKIPSPDALTKVGNFLGSGSAVSVIEQIGHKTNELLASLNGKMDNLIYQVGTNKGSGDSIFPPLS